jgi:hypothetical protein
MFSHMHQKSMMARTNSCEEEESEVEEGIERS